MAAIFSLILKSPGPQYLELEFKEQVPTSVRIHTLPWQACIPTY